MIGYSVVPIVALLCYSFLFLTFAVSKKTNRVIHAFMILMVIMILWTGGSLAMRLQLFGLVNIWHHLSLLGMFMIASGYYTFVVAFLEEKTDRAKYYWMMFHLALFVVNYFTGIFIPEPIVLVSESGNTQFIYEYTWHIGILAACLLPAVLQLLQIVVRHCKGNYIALKQLRPIIIGLLVLAAGNVGSTLPIFAGFPIDMLSGPINAVYVFYALYKKRLFKMTVLFSRSNYFAFSLVVTAALASDIILPLRKLFLTTWGMGYTLTVVLISVTLALLVLGLYLIMTFTFNTIFIQNEKKQQIKIEQFREDINHTLNVTDILQNLTDTVQEITHIEKMIVFLRQTDGDFRVEHTTNPLDEKSFYMKADHPLTAYFKNHGSVSLREFSRTTVYRSMWETEKQLLKTLNANHFIPMSCESGLVGMVVLPFKKDQSPYNTGDLNVVQTIAAICASSVSDASAYERAIDEARKDKLTGLPNRKYFFELLDKDFETYQESALSLCILNIDDFKRYNQLYGTQEGDYALQRVAGVLLSSLNETSKAARIGGKEFVLLLPGYDIHSAKLLTENIVSEIAAINENRAGQVPTMLTVSAGICAAPYMASSARELFQNAETAVYTVKRSGKNAVQIYSSEIYRQDAQQYKYASGYYENESTIYALTAAIDARDHYTFQHSKNVSYYAGELAKAAGMGNDLVEIVKEAALLHDIGKISIREDILNKPGKLTAEEFEIMKGHVDSAVNIISHLPALEYVIPTVYSHHEYYDGSGYPRHLKEEEIPVMGRILCIADSFDAMTSERSYKPALSKEEALRRLQAEAGRQFDPKLSIIFIDLVNSGKIEVRGQNPTYFIDAAEVSNRVSLNEM